MIRLTLTVSLVVFGVGQATCSIRTHPRTIPSMDSSRQPKRTRRHWTLKVIMCIIGVYVTCGQSPCRGRCGLGMATLLHLPSQMYSLLWCPWVSGDSLYKDMFLEDPLSFSALENIAQTAPLHTWKCALCASWNHPSHATCTRCYTSRI